MLLGNNNLERETIKNDIVKTYKVRNDVIHRATSISDALNRAGIKENVKEFTYKIEDYLRASILKLS